LKALLYTNLNPWPLSTSTIDFKLYPPVSSKCKNVKTTSPTPNSYSLKTIKNEISALR
jgi:hypothetical protein